MVIRGSTAVRAGTVTGSFSLYLRREDERHVLLRLMIQMIGENPEDHAVLEHASASAAAGGAT